MHCALEINDTTLYGVTLKSGDCTHRMSYVRGSKCQQVGKGIQDGVALSPDDCWYDLHAHLKYCVDANNDEKPAHHRYNHQHHWCL